MHMITPERLVLLLVIACAAGVTLGMFAQRQLYRKDFDEVYALIDHLKEIKQYPEDSTLAPDSMADLDPARQGSTTPGLDARSAELTAHGYPGTGTHDGIPVITDEITREDVGLPTGDTLEGKVVDAGALWPADTLSPAGADAKTSYDVFGGRTVAQIVDEIEANARRELVSG
jgi:hypothetical protein